MTQPTAPATDQPPVEADPRAICGETIRAVRVIIGQRNAPPAEAPLTSPPMIVAPQRVPDETLP